MLNNLAEEGVAVLFQETKTKVADPASRYINESDLASLFSKQHANTSW